MLDTTFQTTQAIQGDNGHPPDLVRRYAERAIPVDGPMPALVRVEQIGDIWRTPGGRPMHFTATEEFAVDEVGFSWKARLPMAPLLAMRIHDGFARGEGWMLGRFDGVPFMKKSGPELALGAALRYLAEIPWAPHALVANRQIAWRELDAHRVEASTKAGGARAAVTFEFDAAGDIVGVFAESRPRDGDIDRPWRGRFGDYRIRGGIRIPTAGEVSWILPDGRFTYFECAITGVELVGRGATP